MEMKEDKSMKLTPKSSKVVSFKMEPGEEKKGIERSDSLITVMNFRLEEPEPGGNILRSRPSSHHTLVPCTMVEIPESNVIGEENKFTKYLKRFEIAGAVFGICALIACAVLFFVFYYRK